MLLIWVTKDKLGIISLTSRTMDGLLVVVNGAAHVFGHFHVLVMTLLINSKVLSL